MGGRVVEVVLVLGTLLSSLVQIGNRNLAGKVERHLVAKSSQC